MKEEGERPGRALPILKCQLARSGGDLPNPKPVVSNETNNPARDNFPHSKKSFKSMTKTPEVEGRIPPDSREHIAQLSHGSC